MRGSLAEGGERRKSGRVRSWSCGLALRGLNARCGRSSYRVAGTRAALEAQENARRPTARRGRASNFVFVWSGVAGRRTRSRGRDSSQGERGLLARTLPAADRTERSWPDGPSWPDRRGGVGGSEDFAFAARSTWRERKRPPGSSVYAILSCVFSIISFSWLEVVSCHECSTNWRIGAWFSPIESRHECGCPKESPAAR